MARIPKTEYVYKAFELATFGRQKQRVLIARIAIYRSAKLLRVVAKERPAALGFRMQCSPDEVSTTPREALDVYIAAKHKERGAAYDAVVAIDALITEASRIRSLPDAPIEAVS